MKKVFIFCLLTTLFTPYPSFAKKVYRYIKRNHGVSVSGSAFFPESAESKKFITKLNLSYGYNLKGFVEFGPDIGFTLENALIRTWKGKVFTEINFIRSHGRNPFIPSLGLKIGFERDPNSPHGQRLSSQLALAPELYAKAKFFHDLRTAFFISVNWIWKTDLNSLTKAPPGGYVGTPVWLVEGHELGVSFGLSYYFDFY